MTKAGAIAMLKRIQEPEAWEPQINQAAFEALDMAIEALSQESSEDVISRQAAIDALRKMQTYKLFAGDDMILVDKAQAQTELMMLPPVQPERKTGKWIDETFKPWGLVYHPYKCDQCGEHSEADSNFCPNCGADMREEDDRG